MQGCVSAEPDTETDTNLQTVYFVPHSQVTVSQLSLVSYIPAGGHRCAAAGPHLQISISDVGLTVLDLEAREQHKLKKPGR